MTSSPRTVIFWGAGATAQIGMQVTDQQARSLRGLAYEKEGQNSLAQRIEAALGSKAAEPWKSALHDLLIILGDKDGTRGAAYIFTTSPDQMEAMRRNWHHAADDEEVRHRIAFLRTLYDWPALKAAINVCPGVQRDSSSFRLNDLFNILDMHGQSGHGFHLHGETEFLTPQRVLGARNALKLLLLTMLYIDWQYGRDANRDVLAHHYDFALALGQRMQREGMELAAHNTPFDDQRFYMGDVSFVSLNYDPIALWCQFVANRNLNRSAAVPHIGNPASRLQVFHDLGHFVAGTRVEAKEGRSTATPWHPMNEASALQLNDPDHGAHVRIRISKFLFPHGCLWWRECPNCGKLSSYMGDAWEWESPTLIPPPPLRAFAQDNAFQPRSSDEHKSWERGEVDARACMHCETLTYAHHTQTVMQSHFKEPPPPFLEEIRRDLRVAVQNADHIVLMGYSLPLDDVDYRAFFAARQRRSEERKNSAKCSVVVGTDHDARWVHHGEWSAMLPRMNKGEAPRTTLEAAHDLFGKENVRFYGGGIPNVFLDGGAVTDSAVDTLLTWERE